MRLPFKLSFYIGKTFLTNVLMVFIVVSVLIVLADMFELFRRSYNKEVPFLIIIQMVFFKFPLMIQKVIPFAVLIGAVLCYTKLTRTNELIITRSSGVSSWQFLLPSILAAFAIGVFFVTVFNPFACTMFAKYERMENKYFLGQISSLAISSSGLWFRQKNDSENAGMLKGESIIHASHAGHADGELYNVTVFVYEDRDKFVRRIDAQKAVLQNDFWQLKDVIITAPDAPSRRLDEYFLETELTLNQIQDSLASPESISFWLLPGFIKTLKEAGFPAVRHELHWHTILVSPLFYAAMVIIASLFSLSLPRRGRTGLLISASLITGFLIYFLTDVIAALGLSGSIPVSLAAWAPVGMLMLIGMSVLLHLEEG